MAISVLRKGIDRVRTVIRGVGSQDAAAYEPKPQPETPKVIKDMRSGTHIAWEPIEEIPSDRKDGRIMLLWEEDRAVLGSWDFWRKWWEDPESMNLLEQITHWADINPPSAP